MDSSSVSSIQQCQESGFDDLFPKKQRFIDQLPAPNPLLPYAFRPDPVVALSMLKALPKFSRQQHQQMARALAFECCDREFFEGTSLKCQTLAQHHQDQETVCVYMRYELPKQRKHFATLIVPLQQPLPLFPSNSTIRLDLPQYEQPTLEFDSCFESGNLLSAYRISERQYNLILSNDVNSKGNTQWFFFSIRGSHRNQTIRINVINLMKEQSLYQQGMQPLVYSLVGDSKHGTSWHNDGINIKYEKNNITRQDYGNYYTLSFTYTFQYDNDCVYFAHSYPYTLTNLNDLLRQISGHQDIQCRKLCDTIGGNTCSQLTITSSESGANTRCGVVLQARQHPGETTGSYLMEGCIEYLLEDTFESRFLKKNFVFRCFPMLNPDGVVNGNYRCNLTGTDINRNWVNPSKQYFQCIYRAKQSIKHFHLERQIKLILDFHSHSKKLQTFFYGNIDSLDESRVYPNQVCKDNPKFSFQNSRFQVRPSQERTARVALWRMTNLNPNIFTVETSFFGYESGGRIRSYTMDELKDIGRSLCQAFFDLHYKSELDRPIIRPLGLNNRAIKCNTSFAEEKIISQQSYKHQSTQIETLCIVNNTDTSMSESQPSQDELTDRSRIVYPTVTRRKKRFLSRSRKSSIQNVQQQSQKARSASESKNSMLDKVQRRRSPPVQVLQPRNREVQTQTIQFHGKLWLAKEVQEIDGNQKGKRKMLVQGLRCVEPQINKFTQTYLTGISRMRLQAARNRSFHSNNNSPIRNPIFVKSSLLGSLVQKKNANLLFKAKQYTLKKRAFSPSMADTSFQDLALIQPNKLGLVLNEPTGNSGKGSISSQNYLIQLASRRLSHYSKRPSLEEHVQNPFAKRFHAMLNR